MSKDTVIRIENLSKQYRLGLVGTGTLEHDIRRLWYRIRGKEDPYLKIGETNDRSTQGSSDYVWALKDINLEVKRGERIGIIGKNGAGKSTLLKILSQVTGPTTGLAKMKGRVGSLLEVGTGFHPELTGRENIYMNGTILGMKRWEVSRKLDEIVDFAGVERYLDTPVKRYSSGMKVRLGFAVAAHLEPDILIVDEVLAVGDAEFQKKAVGKMKDVSEGHGRTILFVSHNMSSIMDLCESAYLIDEGRVASRGTSQNVVNEYLHGEIDNKSGVFINNEQKINKDEEAVLKNVELLDDNMKPCSSFEQNKVLNVKFTIEVHEPSEKLAAGIHFYNESLTRVFTSTSLDSPSKIKNISLKKGETEVLCRIHLNMFFGGSYYINPRLTLIGKKLVGRDDAYLKFKIKDIESGNIFLKNRKMRNIIQPFYHWTYEQ